MSSTETATWIQAIGSAGSLLAFAAWVGIAVINRRDEFEARFARQAQTVAAWLDLGEEHGSDEEYVVCMMNAGDSPVYRCEVRFPGLAERDEPSGVTTHLLPPHTTMTRPLPEPRDGTSATRLADLGHEQIYTSGIAPEVWFADTSGRRWYRDTEGQLSDISHRSRLRPRNPRNEAGRSR